MLYSHPNMTLKRHLNDVLQGAETLYQKNNIYKDDFEILKYLCLFHDFGKATTYFQKHIRKEKVENTRLTRHSEIGARFAYYYVKNILNWSKDDSFFLYWGIIQHHGKLKNYIDTKQGDFLSENEIEKIYQSLMQNKNEIIDIYTKFDIEMNEEILTNFKDFLDNGIYREARKFSDDDYIRYRYLHSLLIFADTYNAITRKPYTYMKTDHWHSGMIDIYKDKKFKTSNNKIDDDREKCFQRVIKNLKDNSNHNIYSINMPTGFGKTLTSLSVATELKQIHNLDKIIYCLPFTSIIDQLGGVTEEIIEKNNIDHNHTMMLTHHHLSDFEYRGEDEEFRENIAKYLYETWESEFIITTFHQFLNTLFKNKKSVLYRMSKMKDSVIIFDEVQTIPHKYWKVIREFMLMFTEKFNCKLIFMSATLPMIFHESKGEIFELLDNKKEVYETLNRTQIDISMTRQNIDMDVLKNHIIGNLDKNKILVILNTIKSSIKMFERLRQVGSHKLIYLSTNIPPIERLKRIEEIKHSNEPMIVVTTQLVEAGVDIDMDIVYRDFAPLDAIFQASGRCNRNANGLDVSKVILFKMVDEDYKKEIRRFYEYIYDYCLCQWTDNILQERDDIIQESEFFELSNRYYREIKDKASNDVANSILKDMKALRMKSVSDEFNLIDDEKFPVIIFLNDYVENLYNDYVRAIETKEINESRKIFRKLSKYMVNMRIDNLKKIGLYDDEKYMYVIDKDMKKVYYDDDTGVRTEL